MQSESQFLHFIKMQSQNQQGLSHAYLIFGAFLPDEFIKIHQIKPSDTLFLQDCPIKINHIRELKSWLYLKPHSSTLKLAVLYNVEEMKPEAANSLLKVLEEPPAYAVLILQAKKKEKILPTVISRCQIIREKVETDLDLPQNYLSKEKIAVMSVKERFDYAGKIMADEDLAKIINCWEEEARQKLLSGEDTRVILGQISKARSLLSTNTSVKLLLENLLLKF